MITFKQFVESSNLAIMNRDEKLTPDARELLNAIHYQSKVAFLAWKVDKVKNINGGVQFVAKSRKNRKGLQIDLLKNGNKADIILKSLKTNNVTEIDDVSREDVFSEIQSVLNKEL